MPRFIVLIFALAGLAACTNPNDLSKPPAYLGNFQLGHNVVVAPNLVKGPASRAASKEEWIAAMKKAVDARFGRYEGSKHYHFGISIEGYVLAVPGVPVIASPKSAVIIRVTVWDDAAGKKLNEEAELITVVESISGDTVVGSGLTQSKEVQMENLSRNAAKQIETWLVRQNNENGWFEGNDAPEDDKPVPAKPVPEPSEETSAEAESEAEAGEEDSAGQTAPESEETETETEDT